MQNIHLVIKDERKEIFPRANVTISNPYSMPHSSSNKLIRGEMIRSDRSNERIHQYTEAEELDDNRTKDSVLIVTSAVVEYQSSSHSASGESIRSNNR